MEKNCEKIHYRLTNNSSKRRLPAKSQTKIKDDRNKQIYKQTKTQR